MTSTYYCSCIKQICKQQYNQSTLYPQTYNYIFSRSYFWYEICIYLRNLGDLIILVTTAMDIHVHLHKKNIIKSRYYVGERGKRGVLPWVIFGIVVPLDFSKTPTIHIISDRENHTRSYIQNTNTPNRTKIRSLIAPFFVMLRHNRGQSKI